MVTSVKRPLLTCIRPSGTEPKLKFYIGTSAPSLDEANSKLAAFEKALKEFAEE